MLTVRPNWRLAGILMLLTVLCAAAGRVSPLLFGESVAGWLGLILGYIATVVLFANVVGQAVRKRRVQLTAKRLSVTVRGGTADYLRDEIVSVRADRARYPIGYHVPAVSVSMQSGATVAILTGTQEEIAFVAEIIRNEMGLAPDPLSMDLFSRLSGRYVSARVAACGVIAELRRHPTAFEGTAVSVIFGGIGVYSCMSVMSGWARIASVMWAPITSICLGYLAWRVFIRFSPAILCGIWDGEFIFSERLWLRPLARLQYGRNDVAEVMLAPTKAKGRSRLKIVLATGEEVLSDGAWRTPRLQALVDTVNTARRISGWR